MCYETVGVISTIEEISWNNIGGLMLSLCLLASDEISPIVEMTGRLWSVLKGKYLILRNKSNH